MRIIGLLFIYVIFIYGGSQDALITCHSTSGRTQLKIYDMDLEGNFQSGFLSIDGKKIKYDETSDAAIVSHLEKGVYTVYLYTNKATYFLKFYALPKTVKQLAYRKGDKYKFKGIIDPATTDPRSKKRINKTIVVECLATYKWKEI